MKIPDIDDWGIIADHDYDRQTTFNNYYGKNIDEVILILKENFFERALEVDYMPDQVFNYYIFAMKIFIQNNLVSFDDRADASSIFFKLIYSRAKDNPKGISSIYNKLSDLVEEIGLNQEKFDVDIEIYGDFKNNYREIEKNMKSV